MQATMLSAAEIERQFTFRPATMNDLDAAVELFNASAQALVGNDEFSRDELQVEWTQPGLILENNMRLVFTPDGQLIGYGEAWDLRAPYTSFGSWLCVHPDYADIGLAEYLITWIEQRLRQTIAKAPDGTKVTMRLGMHSVNQTVHAAAQYNGMELVRHFFKMGIEFDGPPPAPVWPDGVSLRPFESGRDERVLFHIIDTAFEDHWGHVPLPDDEAEHEKAFQSWWQWAGSEFDPALLMIAVNEAGEPVGGAVCLAKRTDMPDCGWVSNLGVLREGRGKGIGRALLLHAFGIFYERGNKGCGLGVDAENPTGALRLYESAGMRPVGQWDTYSKILRDGVEYTG